MVNESNIEAIFAGMNTTEVVKTRSEKNSDLNGILFIILLFFVI